MSAHAVRAEVTAHMLGRESVHLILAAHLTGQIGRGHDGLPVSGDALAVATRGTQAQRRKRRRDAARGRLAPRGQA